MKKHYVRPRVAMEQAETAELICTSQSVTSEVGIDFGGIDEEGWMPVESRFSEWDDV